MRGVATTPGGTEIEFVIGQTPEKPWNALLGGRLEIGPHIEMVVEGGLGTRRGFVGSLGGRF